jgi:hypothetical protein
MQFQVPQFIETEDKIVGPLSLRQFIYVAVGAGLSGMLFFVLQMWLWIVFTVFLVGGAIAIAFIKIEGRPLSRIIFSAMNYYWSPRTYVWQPEHPQIETYKPPKEKKGKFVSPAKPAAQRPAAANPAVYREKIAEGTTLHEKWAALQTGDLMSDKQFVEKKVSSRYEIFQKMSGERDAARRVDYR